MKEYFKRIYNKTKEEYIKYLEEILQKEEKKFIITANPETIMMSEKDKVIQTMLLDENNSIIPDGIAIVKAGKILGYNIKERIAGIDIAEFLLKYASQNNKKVYLFGSKQEIIDKMKETINKKYSGIKLVGATNGYVKNRDKEFEKIKKQSPDIVLIALGIPHQEKLIYKHLKDFKKGIFVGVGGSLDVISGSKKRAPKIFIKTNTEWLYRIVREPKRLKRFYDNNIKFMFKIKKEK